MNTFLIIAGFSGAVLVVLSFFSSITWSVRLRILAGILTGVVLMGILAWPVVKPSDSTGVVTIPGFPKMLLVLSIAFGVGLLSYFVTWPQGRQIGIIAVPFGLSVWAVKTANIADVFRTFETAQQRLSFYKSLLVEPVFWLVIIAAGFAGVYLAHSFSNKKTGQEKDIKSQSKSFNLLHLLVGIFGSVIIAFLLVTILAQDVKMQDKELGWLIAQPSSGQIAFAVFAAFACAGFIVKRFFSLSYISPVIAAALLSICGILIFGRAGIVEYLTGNWPAVFFVNPLGSILPIQMVAFGTVGAIAGYWLVSSYEIWKKSEHYKMD